MTRKITIIDEILARPVEDEQGRALLDVPLDRCTVRDLIRFRVEQEVARGEDAFLSLMAPHKTSQAPQERTLNSDTTNARAFAAAQNASRVQTPSDTLNAAVQQAYDAFHANAFVLFLNDQQAEDLDDEVVTSTLDQVTFVRLIPLQGG